MGSRKYFFLKYALTWALSDIQPNTFSMIQFDFCRTLGILKRQIEDEKYFLEWGSNPQQYYLQGKNRKYFRSDFGSKKTVEFAFEIN